MFQKQPVRPIAKLTHAALRWIRTLQDDIARLRDENAALKAGQCQCPIRQSGRVLHECPAFDGNIVAHLDGRIIPLQFRSRLDADAFFSQYDRVYHAGECSSCGRKTTMYAALCDHCETH